MDRYISLRDYLLLLQGHLYDKNTPYFKKDFLLCPNCKSESFKSPYVCVICMGCATLDKRNPAQFNYLSRHYK